MSYRVCIDASLAIEWLLPAQNNYEAENLLRKFDKDGAELIAPPLIGPEVTSVIRHLVHLKKLELPAGDKAYTYYCELDIRIMSYPGLTSLAWQLAKKYQQPRTYDMQYVALAEFEGCELWTGDRRLSNSLQGKLKCVRWIGDFKEYKAKNDR